MLARLGNVIYWFSLLILVGTISIWIYQFMFNVVTKEDCKDSLSWARRTTPPSDDLSKLSNDELMAQLNAHAAAADFSHLSDTQLEGIANSSSAITPAEWDYFPIVTPAITASSAGQSSLPEIAPKTPTAIQHNKNENNTKYMVQIVTDESGNRHKFPNEATQEQILTALADAHVLDGCLKKETNSRHEKGWIALIVGVSLSLMGKVLQYIFGGKWSVLNFLNKAGKAG